jgi:hypothetical protein
MIDPDEARYRRNHPRFPGVGEIVRLLKLPGTRGGYLEAILADLGENVPEVLDEVTQAVDEETDERVRALLVGELAETGDRRLVGSPELPDPRHPLTRRIAVRRASGGSGGSIRRRVGG